MSEARFIMESEGVRLLQFQGVHEPDSYSAFLLTAMSDHAEGPLLDLCCGNGFLGLVMAKRGLRVTAVDISAAATEAADLNAHVNDLGIKVLCGDLFAPVADLRFMTIAATPPIMPTPGDSPGSGDWFETSNNGGFDGREIYDRILASARKHLLPGGSLWLLHPWFFSMRKTLHMARAYGLNVQCIETRLFPMGTLSGRRLPHIASLGFLPERAVSGQPMQRMSVIKVAS